MPDRLGGSYPIFWIHLKAATQEVHEQGVFGGLCCSAVDERGYQVPGERRAAKSASPGVSAGDDRDAVLIDRLYAVAWYSAARDEVALALTRREELLAGKTKHLDYASHLIALVFTRKQRVSSQQLHHDATCTKVVLR